MNKRNKHTSVILRSLIVGSALALAAWHGDVARTRAALAMTLAIPKALPLPPLQVPLVKVTSLPVVPVIAARNAQQVRLRLFSSSVVRTLFMSAPASDGLHLGSDVFHRTVVVTIAGGQVHLQMGHKVILGSSLILSTTKGKNIWLRPVGRKAMATSGQIRLTVHKGTLEIVNVLELEDYLMGIVEPELGSLTGPEEAMKAQIIAARSYILAVRDRHPGDDFDFCDSDHCQMYTGMVHFPQKFITAAATTRGLYLRYKNAPAAAFFHHSCGGMTEAIEDVWPGTPVAYLKRVKDSDQEYLGNRGTLWHFAVDRKSFLKLLVQQNWVGPHDALENLKVIRTDASGRAQQILIQGNQQRWIKAAVFRNAVNHYFRSEVLSSLLFQISITPSQVRFEGRGWGHGVGLCQAGAMGMARQGKTYDQILQHYYSGTTLARLPSTDKVSH
jgi:stage II sporulation protein D